MTEQYVRNLVKKFFRKECSPVERQELARWIDQSSNDFVLRKFLEDAWKEFEPVDRMQETKANEILSSILNKGKELENSPDPFETPVRPMWFRKIAVAAMVLVLAGAGSYYLFFNQSTPELAKVTTTPLPVHDEISPGRTQAILTLADGATIALDTSIEKNIATQGSTQVVTRDGELVYNSQSDNSSTVLFNTVQTTRGELYPLHLSDGTKVWLNSASSLHFPVAFNGSDRLVDLTGEAYFEVAKNPAKPFKVKLNGMEIEVLGTHFNINGYADEPIVKTTLIEGSLRVTKGNAGVLLAPGQQAGLDANGKIALIKGIDTTEAISWKNGIFHFNKTSLQNVMRQFARWYNVDVEFENKTGVGEFTGDIRKDSELSEVLRLLETGEVHCKVVGRKIIVLK